MRDIRTQMFFSTIKEGSVYLFISDAFRPPLPHYFVVLNSDPQNSPILLFVNGTTKIDKRKKWVARNKLPASTLTEINPTECAIFSSQTIFNCNSPIPMTAEKIIEKLTSSVFKHKGYVPQELLLKLRQGILDSPLIDGDTKNLVR